jgi:hypothetical protein
MGSFAAAEFLVLRHALNLEAFGGVCHDHGILFIVNDSQAIGARSPDIRTGTIGALCCRFKWLRGPYETVARLPKGFCQVGYSAHIDRPIRASAHVPGADSGLASFISLLLACRRLSSSALGPVARRRA